MNNYQFKNVYASMSLSLYGSMGSNLISSVRLEMY